MNYSFKKYVENKDLNEVGQHVFPDQEGEFPDRDKMHWLSPEDNLELIGMYGHGSDKFAFGSAVEKNGKWYDKNNKLGGSSTPIFEITYFDNKNGIYVDFTNEMKSQLAYNLGRHKNVRDGQINDFKKSVLKSMINLAGAIITKHSQQQMKSNKGYGIPEQIVSFEPIFDFLSDEKELKNRSRNQDQDIKIGLPITLFDKGLKLVALEVENKINSTMKQSSWKDEISKPRNQRSLDRVIRKSGPNIIITSNTASFGKKIDPSRQTIKPSEDKHSSLMDKEREETKKRRGLHKPFISTPGKPNEKYPWKTHEYLADWENLYKKVLAAKDKNIPLNYKDGQSLEANYIFLLQDLEQLRKYGPDAYLTNRKSYNDLKKLINSLEEKQQPSPGVGNSDLGSDAATATTKTTAKKGRTWRQWLTGQ